MQTPKEKSWLAASRIDVSNKAKNARITAIEGVGRAKIKKRLDELTGIFSRRVVSRPLKVTAMGNIEQRSCAIVQIPAKIRPIAVTLAQEE